jgi:hypothetical protein
MAKRARVTPRELAVLRLVPMGRQYARWGKFWGIGEEQLKKVQSKLGVRNWPDTVA